MNIHLKPTGRNDYVTRRMVEDVADFCEFYMTTRPPGFRNGCTYSHRQRDNEPPVVIHVYRTKAGTVVARQIPD